MDSRRTAEDRLTPDAAEFVRFCYRRRAVGWPELYDEMCAVASRGLFRGWGRAELAEHGVGFTLFDMPALAGLVARVVAEEHASVPRRLGFSVGRAGRSPRPALVPVAIESAEDDVEVATPRALAVAAVG